MTTDISLIKDMVLIKVTVRAYLGTVRSDKAARDAENTSGAEMGSVDASVKNLAEEYAGPIRHARSVIRKFWYENTLPWLDGGYRIVPASEYQKLMDGIAKLVSSVWERPVQKLLDNYDQVRVDAQARLGGLFDEQRFPNRENLADKFDVDVFRSSVQNPGDIRINGLMGDAIEEIQKEVSDKYAVQIKGAVDQVVDTIRATMISVAERMDRPGKGAKYKGLWGTVQRLVDTLPALNITGNEEISKAIDGMREEIAGVDLTEIREKTATREQVKSAALRIEKGLTASGKPSVAETAITKSGIGVTVGQTTSGDLGNMFK